MRQIEAVVEVDYSQWVFATGASGSDLVDVGLMRGVDDVGQVVLSAAREYGPVAIRVEVLDEAPLLDGAWRCVAEMSVVVGQGASVRGWEPSEYGVAVPVVQGASYRLRYVVLGGQLGAEQFADASRPDEEPAVESYLLQLWQAPAAGAVVVRADEPWATYWLTRSA